MGTEFDYSNYYYNKSKGAKPVPRAKLRPKKSGTRYSTGQKRGIVICAAIIVLCLVAYIITGHLGGVRDQLTVKGGEFYAVCLGTYADESSAKAQSTRVRARGAGGYIASDNSYKVLASCYKTKKEAESVIAALKKSLTDATLYIIKIPDAVILKLNESAQSAVAEALGAYGRIYSALYDITVGIDTGEFLIEEILNALNAAALIVSGISQRLDSLGEIESPALLAHIKALYVSLGNMLSSMNLHENYFDISLNLRYNYLKILFMFIELFKEINT